MGNSFGDEVARVSRYLMGRTPSISPSVPGTPIQLQWNVESALGTESCMPFAGDYIDIATLPYLPPDPTANPPRVLDTQQRAGPGRTPNVLIAWTDNRDMRDLARRSSTPTARFRSQFRSTSREYSNSSRQQHRRSQSDATGLRAGSVFKTGTTNQNIYAARAVLEFAASSPSGNKTLGSISRTFVVTSGTTAI